MTHQAERTRHGAVPGGGRTGDGRPHDGHPNEGRPNDGRQNDGRQNEGHPPGGRIGDERTGTILRATGLVGVLTVLGSLLGLVRDLMVAQLFGATGHTDAFLVAWTLPETASPLLIEGAMAFLMVPIFVRALAERGGLAGAISATLPRVTIMLTLATAALVLAAPLLVRGLAPGIVEHELAVTCTRITAVSVLAFGVAGYLGAVLRSAHRFGWAGAIYVAYNVGILAALMLLHRPLGVIAACIGITAGGLLMVLVQLPGARRLLATSERPAASSRQARRQGVVPRVALGAFIPIAAYTLTRQAQVWIERFLGSDLAAGTISQLNYAQKVAQVPMVLAVLLATVTFPMLARRAISGDTAGGRARMTWDLRMVSAIVLVATAYLIAFASPIIELLFEHGAFTPADTAATAQIMRVYALGLLGQAGVAVLSRTYFSDGRPGWQPALIMSAGLAVTALVSAVLMPVWQAPGIVAGNVAGITLTAIAFLPGVRRRLSLDVAAIGSTVARLVLAALGAGLIGWLLCQLMGRLPTTLTLAAGGLAVGAAFVILSILAGAVRPRGLNGMVRRLRHET